MSNKKSFLLHIDSLSVLDDLTDEQAGALFKAIKVYQEGGDLDLDQVTKIAFSPFRNQFIREAEKYEETCKRRALAGAKGGKAKAAKASKPLNNKQDLASASKSQQDLASARDKDSDKDSDKDINKNTMSAAAANPTLEVFNFWKEVMKKNNSATLNAKRDKAIKARLKEGYTVEQIKQAIVGCSMTPHNMGQNDNGKRYDDIELICRDGCNLERFANNSQPRQTQAYGAHVEKTLAAVAAMEWDDDM